MAKPSPTQRSLAYLRKQGGSVAIVEHWNSFIGRRQDLFGVIDLLHIGEHGTTAIQTTSGTNVSARKKKIVEAPAYRDMLAAGWQVRVHGWRKLKSGKWKVRDEGLEELTQ